jgi:hypothetical protein
MARRRKNARKRRGSRSRSAAAKKAARTRKRNKAKRRAAGRKAARTRRRNSRKRPARRRNARRRPAKRRNARRRVTRRRNSRRRRNPSMVRSTTTTLRSLTKPRMWRKTLTDGGFLAAGYAGVNALRAIESRFGLDAVMDAIPGGIARTVAEYALKIVNIGLTTQIAGMVVKGSNKANIQKGGLTNLGVQFLSDVSSMFGGTGEIVRGYLGDYNLAYNMGTSMAPALGNYNLVQGGQVMASSSGIDVYAPVTGVY